MVPSSLQMKKTGLEYEEGKQQFIEEACALQELLRKYLCR